MSEERGPWAFQQLVIRYADGRQICNCREAYYAFNEDGHKFCKWGCSANLIAAKEEIARRALAEITAGHSKQAGRTGWQGL